MTITTAKKVGRTMDTPVPVEVPAGFWQREASHIPKPLSPLFRILLPMANSGFRRMFAEMGVLPEGLEWREIGGWVYTRVIPPGGKDRRPPPRPLFPLLVRLVPALRRSVRRATDAVRSDRFGGYLECWHSQWRPELVGRITELRDTDLGSLDDRALGHHLDDVMALTRRAWDTHFLLHGVNAYILADLAFTCRDLLGWTDARALELVSGLSEASTAPAARIAELAAMARERPAVRHLLEDDVDGPAVGIEALEAADPEFAAAFADYQCEFGFRAIRYEVAEATAAERPGLALRLIADQLQSGFDPAARLAAARERRESARTEARQALAGRSEADRARFERALARAERFYPVREDNAPMTVSEPVALVRRVALEVGERLVARSVIDERDDIFFLELDELTAAIDSMAGGTPADHRPLVGRRKEERAWVEAHPGPASYGVDPGVPPLDALPPEAAFANQALLWLIDRIFAIMASAQRQEASPCLTGLAASSGSYTGPVRVLLDESDFAKLRPGDVLVCPITSPAWSVLFANAGALVTDTGGLLSHPAIIAREFHIPAIVATGNATELLADGQRVTVDGSDGTITVHT